MYLTYVNGHVEVVWFEVVGHFSEALQGVLPHRLLEAKRLSGLTALLWAELKTNNFASNTNKNKLIKKKSLFKLYMDVSNYNANTNQIRK